MRHTAVTAGLAICAMVLAIAPADAGGSSKSCYEQAVVPASYRTVQEKVLVQPARKYAVSQPAVYAYRTKRVVIQPERVSYRRIAPIYETRHRKVMVQQASIGWEYQIRHGKKILCKVKRPAVYRSVAETVQLKPGGKVAIRQPAIYGTVQERYVVSPASSRMVREPAVYRLVNRQVQVSAQQVVWRPISSKCRR